jgi:hypothetical protein
VETIASGLATAEAQPAASPARPSRGRVWRFAGVAAVVLLVITLVVLKNLERARENRPATDVAMGMLKSGIDRVTVDEKTAVIEGRATTGEYLQLSTPVTFKKNYGDGVAWKENTRFTNIMEVRGSFLRYRVLDQAGQDVGVADNASAGQPENPLGPADIDLHGGKVMFQKGPFRYCDAETTRWGTNGTIRIGSYFFNAVETPVFVSLERDVERRSDNIKLPFVNDPAVLGEWKSVDFVDKPSDFVPSRPSGRWLWLEGFKILKGGGIDFLSYRGEGVWKATTWTKGFVLEPGVARQYEIRDVQGKTYLFLEWKNDDYKVFGAKPKYYVLEKLQGDSPDQERQPNQ